jgi:hypothetical protein
VGLALGIGRHWLFGLVLIAALALRVLASLAFRPIMWFGGDSASYLATGLRLIPDPSRVGGYGFLLRALAPRPGPALHSLATLAALQHVMPVGYGGSAQVDDVGGGYGHDGARGTGARGGADQQPAVRVDSDGGSGERLTAGEFGPYLAADRAGALEVGGAQAAGLRVARGLAPG